MRVLLADDDTAVCSALRLLLEDEPDIEIVGEVNAASDLASHLLGANIDLLIIDWELPGLSACPLRHALATVRDHLKLIAISGRTLARAESLAAGADGFISKTDPTDRVLALLRALAH